MPSVTEVPITGSVVSWAIEQAGTSVSDVAARLGLDAALVQAWIDGAERPGKTQFRRLAQALGRPESVFFLESPPAERSLPPSFRHPPGAAGSRQLLKKEAVSLKRASRAQRIAVWVAEKEGLQGPELPAIASNVPAERAAETALQYFNWSASAQAATASPLELVSTLRDRFESIGILVLHLPLTESGSRGFSLYHAVRPLIAVNTAYNPEARAFTYLHEFGHLLRRTDALCTLALDTALERWCEEFASAFLLPTSVFLDYVESTFPNEPVRTVQQVGRIARHFRVSLRAVAVRLERLGRAEAGLYDHVNEVAEFRGRGGGGGGETTAEKRFREFGPGYSRLLIDAERRGIVKSDDLLEYLNVSNSQLRDLRLLAATGN